MNISFQYPSISRLDKFLSIAKKASFSYSEVGTSIGQFPPGFNHDFNKIYLGKGEKIWKNAKNALQNWQHFPKPWTAIHPNTTPLEKDEVVVVLFRLFGIWWFNSSKIVYAFDEANRYGFAYGTLTKHVEIGEECFWIERNEAGEIYYHIKAFSKPNYWYVKIVKPLARKYQRQFVQDSFQQMKTLAHATENPISVAI